jgi:hypothetical protein
MVFTSNIIGIIFQYFCVITPEFAFKLLMASNVMAFRQLHDADQMSLLWSGRTVGMAFITTRSSGVYCGPI